MDPLSKYAILAAVFLPIGIAIAYMIDRAKKPKLDVDHGPDVGFDQTAQNAIGILLLVKCNGEWAGYDANAPAEQPEIPKPFKMRLIRFTEFTSRGRRTGAIGRIEDADHPLDGYWAAFVPRWMGSWNFIDRIGPCNIIIGPQEPTQNADVWKTITDCSPILAGFCEIKQNTGIEGVVPR
ncbi:hypothetical protein LLG95_15810 [bacterium]|nr:hypothetical protein [bacterium]